MLEKRIRIFDSYAPPVMETPRTAVLLVESPTYENRGVDPSWVVGVESTSAPTIVGFRSSFTRASSRVAAKKEIKSTAEPRPVQISDRWIVSKVSAIFSPILSNRRTCVFLPNAFARRALTNRVGVYVDSSGRHSLRRKIRLWTNQSG